MNTGTPRVPLNRGLYCHQRPRSTSCCTIRLARWVETVSLGGMEGEKRNTKSWWGAQQKSKFVSKSGMPANVHIGSEWIRARHGTRIRKEEKLHKRCLFCHQLIPPRAPALPRINNWFEIDRTPCMTFSSNSTALTLLHLEMEKARTGPLSAPSIARSISE